MLNCAYCGRENLDEAAQCRECGTALRDKPANIQASAPLASDNPARALAQRRMIAGAFWCIGGLLFTLFTYLIAASRPRGGTYFLAWGAIAFGALQFFRGWMGKDDRPSTEDLGYQELEYASHLESAGRIPETLAAYQSVMEKYPDTDAGRDARTSIASLQARRG